MIIIKRLVCLLIVVLLLFSSCAKNPAEFSSNVLPMEEIWKIEDKTEFIFALSDRVFEKCQYGDNMSALSEPERIFFITQSVEMEVNNGGFEQFFFNSSGNFSNEIVDAFNKIGAIKTAEICQKAISAFGTEIPKNRAKRQDLMASLEDSGICDIFYECDIDFYDYPDNLDELNYEYILKNKDYFS